MLVSAGLGAGIGIVTSALANWRKQGITEAVFQERLEMMKAELKSARADSDKDLKEQMVEVRATTLMLAKLQSSQDVTNTMSAKTLESVVGKVEILSKSQSELQATMSLIREWLDRQNKQ